MAALLIIEGLMLRPSCVPQFLPQSGGGAALPPLWAPASKAEKENTTKWLVLPTKVGVTCHFQDALLTRKKQQHKNVSTNQL